MQLLLLTYLLVHTTKTYYSYLGNILYGQINFSDMLVPWPFDLICRWASVGNTSGSISSKAIRETSRVDMNKLSNF